MRGWAFLKSLKFKKQDPDCDGIFCEVSKKGEKDQIWRMAPDFKFCGLFVVIIRWGCTYFGESKLVVCDLWCRLQWYVLRVGVFGLIFENALSGLILDLEPVWGVLCKESEFRSTFRLVGFFKIRQFLLITPNFLTFQLYFSRFRWGFFMVKIALFRIESLIW